MEESGPGAGGGGGGRAAKRTGYTALCEASAQRTTGTGASKKLAKRDAAQSKNALYLFSHYWFITTSIQDIFQIMYCLGYLAYVLR